MKRFYKLFACWVSVLLLVFSSGMQSHASFDSLLISTDSNALMTMELDDSDYMVMPMSSIASVTNTIGSSKISGFVYISDANGANGRFAGFDCIKENGRYKYRYTCPDGYYVRRIFYRLYGADMPRPGSYKFSMDVSSDISYEHGSFYIYWDKLYENAAEIGGNVYPPAVWDSGDLYIAPYSLDISNVYYMDIYQILAGNENISVIGGSFAINFTLTESGDYPSIGGMDTSEQDYQSDVSSSLSDLSSSVDTMTDEIGGVTEAIQNLQGAMEPHYSNVLTQLHHITEQLHAFYDQVYNNIHLPELDMLTQIRTAIENIDLQIEVDISEVKTAINNMSTAVQNKLQATTDQITGGFDNSQQTQQNQQLQDSINAYDEVEEDIFEDVDGFMAEFEYPSFDSMNGSVIKALAFIGGFLQSIFLSMGDFGTIITFGLTMIFVMIIVGYHRIRS